MITYTYVIVRASAVYEHKHACMHVKRVTQRSTESRGFPPTRNVDRVGGDWPVTYPSAVAVLHDQPMSHKVAARSEVPLEDLSLIKIKNSLRIFFQDCSTHRHLVPPSSKPATKPAVKI